MKKAFALLVLTAAMTMSVSAKRIVINLTQQRACAYEGSSTVFCGNISTGKPGHRTPTGYYHVRQKDIDHVSSKYPEPNGGAKMSYMLGVTAGGIAMHLGYVPSYPASHGCIRMENGFAQRMYYWANVGTPIRIIGTPPTYVSRSSYKKTYGTTKRAPRATKKRRARRTTTRRRVYSATATDILAEFMGKPAARAFVKRKATRYRSVRKSRTIQKKRRSYRRNRRRTKRHGDPLAAMSRG